jgi:hypothetical protein
MLTFGGDHDRLRPGRRDPRGEVFQAVGASGDDRDRGALGSERERSRLADSARGTRDDGEG